MAEKAYVGGKRDKIARGLYWSGALSLLSHFPQHDSLLVLTYHRIGNAETDLWDPGVFSATGEQLDEQVSFLKRRDLLVTLDEALEYVDGTHKDKSSRCRVLITFDDGYLDNYEIAFPILHSHGAQGLFFLCSGFVGTCKVLWWDKIAYLVKSSGTRKFSLSYPAGLNVDIDKYGLRFSLRSILDLYERMDNKDPERFIGELKEALGGGELPPELQRYLNWDQAREMLDGGMAIGAHTHSHRRLSLLSIEEQWRELTESRAALTGKLGIRADVLAYPFGSPTAFTKGTQLLVEEAGYRAAFSYYGRMTNRPAKIERFNLKRVCVGLQSWTRFQAQTGISSITGSFWP